ncbi:MAG: hypothetical protein AB2747_07820 [Candidatus Thiodiazotropha taylori]
MGSCCSSPNCESNRHHKHRCPVNSKEYPEVTRRTMIHHLKEPWCWYGTAKHYYFCDDPNCDVVYFGNDDSVINKRQLRTRIGVKEQGSSDLLCYCFGVSREDYQHNPDSKDFVIAQTKMGHCSCETSNPSGRCCLKDFPNS